MVCAVHGKADPNRPNIAGTLTRPARYIRLRYTSEIHVLYQHPWSASRPLDRMLKVQIMYTHF